MIRDMLDDSVEKYVKALRFVRRSAISEPGLWERENSVFKRAAFAAEFFERLRPGAPDGTPVFFRSVVAGLRG